MTILTFVAVCTYLFGVIVGILVCRMWSGETNYTQDHYRQTPGPSVPAFHNRIQKWACGHRSQQWWFQRYDDDILAAGTGVAPTAFYSDYQRNLSKEQSIQRILTICTILFLAAIVYLVFR